MNDNINIFCVIYVICKDITKEVSVGYAKNYEWQEVGENGLQVTRCICQWDRGQWRKNLYMLHVWYQSNNTKHLEMGRGSCN